MPTSTMAARAPEEPERRPEARPRHTPALARPVLLQEPGDVGSLGHVRSDLERPGQVRPRLLRDAEPEVELAQRAARREGAGCERERRLQVLEGLLDAPGASAGDRARRRAGHARARSGGPGPAASGWAPRPRPSQRSKTLFPALYVCSAAKPITTMSPNTIDATMLHPPISMDRPSPGVTSWNSG